MESFLEDGPTRAVQLDAIFGALNRYSSSSRSSGLVLSGDLNFGEGEAESEGLLCELRRSETT